MGGGRKSQKINAEGTEEEAEGAEEKADPSLRSGLHFGFELGGKTRGSRRDPSLRSG